MSPEAALSDRDSEFMTEEPVELTAKRLHDQLRGWFKRPNQDEVDVEPPTSVIEIDHERTRRALKKLVSSFNTEGLSFDDRYEYRADPRSTTAATAFVSLLPSEYQFPKVAPDAEGDVMMIWEAGTTVLLTIEAWKLHVVVDPATPKSKHLPEMMFDGDSVPRSLLEYLPLR